MKSSHAARTDKAGRTLYVGARIGDAIRAAGFTDLQETHMQVFSYPPPDGIRPSDLARRLNMSR